jgi:LysM repeat protein
MKLKDIPEIVTPRRGDIIEIEQNGVCFEVRIIGITADGYLCEQDNIQGAVLLESTALDETDATDIEDFLRSGGRIKHIPYKKNVEESGLQYYTGVKKHGEKYMKLAAKAGREGASQEELGRLRDRYSKAEKIKEGGHNRSAWDSNMPSWQDREQRAMDADKRAFKYAELQHELGHEEEPYRPQRRYSSSTNSGMYFYNVKPNRENEARSAGLKQTKSGKWYSKMPNQQADKMFGPGKFWQPKSKDVTEASEPISIKVRKGRSKFATELSINGQPAGIYQYDSISGRSIAEIYPEYKSKGYGKILVLHAISTAAKLGMNFVEDESRTREYNNVLDSLSDGGFIIDDDGNWYVTDKGEQYLKQLLKPGVVEGARIARKPGQPANSKKHSDLYTDENPIGTITGLKFATAEDARASVSKIRNSGRSHAHKIQAAVAMEQRAKAAGKAEAAAVYRKYINANKKTNEEQQNVAETAKWHRGPKSVLPEEGVNQSIGKTLSVQQLATISDEALDNAYGYGRSTPGNTFGWQANLMSAAYAKKMIDAGVTDIERISDAIHKGWNVTAQKFVQNPDQFDDTEKLRQAGKLDAKLQQREKLMKINYAQLDNEEQEKDRVVARALLQAIKGEQGVAEGSLNKRLKPQLNEYTFSEKETYMKFLASKVKRYGTQALKPDERKELVAYLQAKKMIKDSSMIEDSSKTTVEQDVTKDQYKIVPGDNLSTLAKRFGTTVDAIMAVNPQIKNANRIQAGANLNLPNNVSQPQGSIRPGPNPNISPDTRIRAQAATRSDPSNKIDAFTDYSTTGDTAKLNISQQIIKNTKKAFKQEFGQDLKTNSEVRSREQQEDLFIKAKSGQPGIFMPANPNKFPNAEYFHLFSMDISPRNLNFDQRKWLEQNGWYLKFGAKDPVHWQYRGMTEAKYQGREVPLGKKMAGDVKKSKVYVRKPNGKIVKVNFGDKNMKIKKSNPARRKSFRARHNCDNPGPRWKARYWSCRSW